MTLDVLGDLNWLAVLVAAIAFFALGAVWYAQPVFGKAWTRASNFQLPEGDTLGASFYIEPIGPPLLDPIPLDAGFRSRPWYLAHLADCGPRPSRMSLS